MGTPSTAREIPTARATPRAVGNVIPFPTRPGVMTARAVRQLERPIDVRPLAPLY